MVTILLPPRLSRSRPSTKQSTRVKPEHSGKKLPWLRRLALKLHIKTEKHQPYEFDYTLTAQPCVRPTQQYSASMPNLQGAAAQPSYLVGAPQHVVDIRFRPSTSTTTLPSVSVSIYPDAPQLPQSPSAQSVDLLQQVRPSFDVIMSTSSEASQSQSLESVCRPTRSFNLDELASHFICRPQEVDQTQSTALRTTQITIAQRPRSMHLRPTTTSGAVEYLQLPEPVVGRARQHRSNTVRQRDQSPLRNRNKAPVPKKTELRPDAVPTFAPPTSKLGRPVPSLDHPYGHRRVSAPVQPTPSAEQSETATLPTITEKNEANTCASIQLARPRPVTLPVQTARYYESLLTAANLSTEDIRTLPHAESSVPTSAWPIDLGYGDKGIEAEATGGIYRADRRKTLEQNAFASRFGLR